MIAIENLVKRHGAREVLHGVSLEARPGRVTGFVGPNGAGKSSTLRCLLGLDRADGGRALIGGRPYRELREQLCTEVLVLDEPVNGLDPEGIRWIRRLLRQRADAGGTVLLSSHVLAELAEVADDVVVIAGGRVRAAGTLEEVAAGYANLEEAFFSLTAPTGGEAGGGASQAGRTGRAEREEGVRS